jgi:hypothetical protein
MPSPSRNQTIKISSKAGMRKGLMGLAVLLLVVMLIEGMSLIIISVLPRFTTMEVRTTRAVLEEQRHLAGRLLDEPGIREELDPLLGWIYRPGFSSDADKVNSDGARSAREYGRSPGGETLRLTAYGDSFAYGTEVSVADGWSAVLERIAPTTEVLNFAVGGYGTDQAFLRYLEHRGAFGEDLVLIGFAPVNLRRSVNVFRRFISDRDLPLVKPRFALQDTQLILIPNPLPSRDEYRRLVDAPREAVLELGRNDSWYDPLTWENPLHDLSPTVRLLTRLGTHVVRTRLSANRLMTGGMFTQKIV